MRYQIVAEYNINGKIRECLCNVPTASGDWMFTFDKVEAEKRVAELKAIGMNAFYEALPMGTAWFDN